MYYKYNRFDYSIDYSNSAGIFAFFPFLLKQNLNHLKSDPKEYLRWPNGGPRPPNGNEKSPDIHTKATFHLKKHLHICLEVSIHKMIEDHHKVLLAKSVDTAFFEEIKS